jgi:hypothetical protein
MIINDLVILGRASPDRLRDNRETVCTAGFSNTYGFVRIYPTKTDSPLKRWNVVSVEVERDPRDTREESWKIQGSKKEWRDLNKKIEVLGELKQKDIENLIVNHLDGCVLDINDSKRSLGIVKPLVISRCSFGQREGYNPYVQYSLLRRFPILGKRNFPLVPRIEYKCSNCKAKSVHNQQVIDWGFYEWMRKYPDKKDQVWENAQIGNPNSDIYFLVGNQMLHRRSYMIISVFSIPKSPQNPNQMTL